MTDCSKFESIGDQHAGVVGYSTNRELLRQCVASGQVEGVQIVAHGVELGARPGPDMATVLRGQVGVAVALLRECIGPLEVSAAAIESDDTEQIRASCAKEGTGNVKFHIVKNLALAGWQAVCGGTSLMSQDLIDAHLVAPALRCRKSLCQRRFHAADEAARGVAPAEAPTWAEVAQWLHAAYDRPPQTPEVKAMLARVDAAAAGVPPLRPDQSKEN